MDWNSSYYRLHPGTLMFMLIAYQRVKTSFTGQNQMRTSLISPCQKNSEGQARGWHRTVRKKNVYGPRNLKKSSMPERPVAVDSKTVRQCSHFGNRLEVANTRLLWEAAGILDSQIPWSVIFAGWLCVRRESSDAAKWCRKHQCCL